VSDFIGTYANLQGMKIGRRFRVDELAGRDKAGAPRWKVVCDVCWLPQTLPHSKVANLVQGKRSQISLLCSNPACPSSRHENENETITQFRRRERREAQEAAASAAKAQRAAELLAAKQRINDDKFADLKTQYRTYWLHQIKTAIDEAEIVSLPRWSKLSDATRQQILTACAADPTVQIRF
jgi:hypothetical protein